MLNVNYVDLRGFAMKITDVRMYLLESPLQRPFAYSRGWVDRRSVVLVEISTDSDLTGWGEAFGPGRMAIGALKLVRPLLIGADPLAIEKIWDDLYGRFRDHGSKGPLIDALSAIDIALWDIKGKHFKLPVHRLMGGPLRTSVPAYASGLFRYRDGDIETNLVKEAERHLARGFRAMKMKVGFGVDADVRAVKAVRKTIGPDVSLMIDANGAYDAVNAIRLAHRIDDCDVAWFEEPVPPEDIEGYLEVKARQPIPVAGGEAEFTRFGFRDILARRAMDIIQPDICAAGGFSECKKIVDMAHAFGVRCSPHTWGTAIAISASLHLLAMLPNTTSALYPIPPLLEWDCTEHGIRDALLTDALRPVDGVAQIPEAPGLGVDIDREVVRKFEVQ
jgi:D-galactarolactone cycloisomerase